MNIAEQIADILARNPDGLKASEIASQIGCTRKEVNSYLYAHTDTYEQHEGYIWTLRSVQRNNPSKPYSKLLPLKKPCRVTTQQNLENDEKVSAPNRRKNILSDYWSDGSGISYYRLWKVKIYDGSYAYGVEWTENKGKKWLVLKSFSTEWEAELYLMRCVSQDPNRRLWGAD